MASARLMRPEAVAKEFRLLVRGIVPLGGLSGSFRNIRVIVVPRKGLPNMEA